MTIERYMPGDTESGGPTPEEIGVLPTATADTERPRPVGAVEGTPPPLISGAEAARAAIDATPLAEPTTTEDEAMAAFLKRVADERKRDGLPDGIGGLGGLEMSDPPHTDEEEIIRVRLPGYPTDFKIVCPTDPKEGLRRWRSLQGRIESEDASDKGSFGAEKQNMELLIGHFSNLNNKVEPKYREMARLMVEEEFARSNILEAWGQHRNATDYKGLAQAQDVIRGRALNYLFENDEFIESMNYLEHHAQEYWRAKPLEKLKIKEQLQVELIMEKGYGSEKEKATVTAYKEAGDVDGRIDKLSKTAHTPEHDVELNNLLEVRQQYKSVLFKYAWSGMAEKVWLISLRGYMHVDLKKSESEEVDPKTEKKGFKYEWDMEGTSGAAVGARKLLKLKRWGRTQEAAARPVNQLLTGFNHEASDFFTQQIVKNSKWFSEEKRDTVMTKKEFSEYDDEAAGEKQYTIDFKKIQERIKETDPDKKVNFSALTDNDLAMKYHSYRHVTKPGDFMVALTDGNNSFLMNPNKDTLYALNDKFDYLEGGKWKAKKLVMLNYIDYAKNERNAATGKARYTHREIVDMVNDFVGLLDDKKAPFIRPEDRQATLREALKNENIILRIYNKKGVKGLIFFLLGFFGKLTTGILKHIGPGPAK